MPVILAIVSISGQLQTPYGVEIGVELLIFLPLSPECWDSKLVPQMGCPHQDTPDGNPHLRFNPSYSVPETSAHQVCCCLWVSLSRVLLHTVMDPLSVMPPLSSMGSAPRGVLLKFVVKFPDSQGQINIASWGLEPSLYRTNPCSFPKASLSPLYTFSQGFAIYLSYWGAVCARLQLSCRDQRVSCRNWLSPSPMCVSGIELMLPGLVAFTHGALNFKTKHIRINSPTL